MPFKHTTVAFPKGQITTQNDLDALIVKNTQGTVKFNGLLLDLPFGKRGATELRTTAKTYGARWDGKEWTISSAKYPTLTTGGGLTWLLDNAVIAGIKTRVYTVWVWDGRSVDVALDLPFEDRSVAKQHGAKWDPNSMRWYLPAVSVTQSKIDALNAAEAIDGEIDSTGKVVAQANIGQAQAPAVSPAAPKRMPYGPSASDSVRLSAATLIAALDANGNLNDVVRLIEDKYIADEAWPVHSLRHEAGEVSVLLLPEYMDRVVIVHWKRHAGVAQVMPTLCNSGATTVAEMVREFAELAVIADRASSRKVYETLANQYGYKPMPIAAPEQA